MQPLSRRSKILAMLGMGLALFLVSIDGTVVGTAMPRVIADLNGFQIYAWVATAYLLTQTAILPIAGKLGDMVGRKRVAVAGVAVFLAASAFCGIARSMWWLIAWRGVQGLGASALITTIFVLVADIFPDIKDRARYQGLLFSVFGFSSVFGPVLGGWITDSLSWRWVFFLNLPLGALALITLPIVLPHDERRPAARIDWAGAITIVTAVVALLVSVEAVGAGAAWTSAEVVAGLLIAAIGFVAFVPIEMRAADPVIPMSLFRIRTVSVVAMVAFLGGAATFGIALYTPLFVQGVLGRSASFSGTIMTPQAITMALMGILVGQLIARTGRLKRFLLLGGGLASLGIVGLVSLPPTVNPLFVGGVLLVVALGNGMLMPVQTLAVQSAVEPRLIGIVTAATNFTRLIGSTVGTALIGAVVSSSYSDSLATRAIPGVPAPALAALQSPNALIDQRALQGLSQMMAGLTDSGHLTQVLLDTARLSLAGAIRHGYQFILAAALLALACSFFFVEIQLGAPHAVHGGESRDGTPQFVPGEM